MKCFIGILSVAVVAATLFACADCHREGMRAGMPAPKIVYSCTVKNEFASPVDVEVVYSHPFENRLVTDRATLAVGDSKFFDRREFQTVEKTNFAAVVSRITVRDVATGNELSLTKDDFKIYSPTVNYKVNVVPIESTVGFELQHAANL